MPSMLSRVTSRRWSRFVLVGVLLCLAVGTTGALTWEAVRSARTARATAESVLRDYSRLAAWQFARETQTRLDARLNPILTAALHQLDGRHQSRGATGSDPLPDNDGCNCQVAPAVVTRFLAPAAGAPLVIGSALAPEILDRVRAEAASAADGAACGVFITETGDGLRVVAFQDAGLPPTSIVGIVAKPALLVELFAQIFDHVPLLPQSLTDGAPSAEFFSVRVVDADRREVFSSGGSWSAYAGDAALPARLAGLRVEASIHADRASRLVIGGLPSERWPIAVGLLGLSTGLVVLAVLQLRREVRFTRQQSEFVSGVSHELRTPLAQIRLFAETLLLGRVRSREEERRAAEVIVQESRRLGALVDNVLLFSRTSARRVEIRPEPVDLGELARDVIDSFRSFAAAREATLSLDVTGLVETVLVDRDACRQILVNLLDNAVKYGPRGQHIRIRVDRTPAGVRIVVEDEGPGVAPEHARHIWEPFWRASGSPEGGSGLGLAIVSELARLHGGTASVDVSAARGARFIVTLDDATAPAARADRAAPQPA